MEYAVAIEKSWFNMKESIYDQYYLSYRVRNCKHGQGDLKSPLCKLIKTDPKAVEENSIVLKNIHEN